MVIRRITVSDLAFGEPLPWDIFSTPTASRPLVPKGQVIAPGQLDSWLAAGLYAETAAPASILQSLNQVNRRLERTLLDLRAESSADSTLRAVAQQVIDSVERDPDIALASIFLTQIAGAYPVRHCTETAIVVCLIARALGKTPAEVLVVTAAALTMNAGMVRQAEIFQGKDCALSSAERALVRRHPLDGVDLLRWAGVTDEEWLSLVLLHHETDDGSGYPEGRLGNEISQNTKLIGIADRYCAFVSARNYRRSLLPPVAIEKLSIEPDMPVDQAIIGHFIEQIGAYPPGTLVRLHNGESGVVASRMDQAGAQRVHVLRGADGAALEQRRSTTEAGCAISEAMHEDQAGLRFSMKQIWGELASI